MVGFKQEFNKVEEGFLHDKHFIRIKTAHEHINEFAGGYRAGYLVLAGSVQGLSPTCHVQDEAYAHSTVRRHVFIMTHVYWLWYRIEYKDQEIEFVLENLGISSSHTLPPHIYIRHITDVNIQTPAEPAEPSHTAVSALTHVRAQAIHTTSLPGIMTSPSPWVPANSLGSSTSRQQSCYLCHIVQASHGHACVRSAGENVDGADTGGRRVGRWCCV
ncbi:hypothetical protein P691DRAFT_142966 [Macrolepiota fuliginosa MF-IS2]|uniref:Uncharacterized protein n=1 Tax=Macrolepiota fuliginosa MF-IS2 TaxID=1400762 RepID=A0A9P6C343_9AGAR|nr:hypothetical protein P691DRAFT_142966 [Macrolepiota fuliginosa MF-IS2]